MSSPDYNYSIFFHQLYILLSFDSVRALEIHDVARATSCIACALEMCSSNGRERPLRSKIRCKHKILKWV